MTGTPLRADAERNRRLLVDTAQTVFAERGLDAPLDEIARRAGLGNATLYRRFPSRCRLVAAVFTETMREILRAATSAVAQPDPWAGFTGHLRFLCRLQAGNRALADLLTTTITGDDELDELRGRAHDATATLILRAQAAGALRADFQHQDIVLILMANAGLLERIADTAPRAWERHLSYLLDGLRAAGATPAPPAPDQRQVRRAMDSLGRHGAVGRQSTGAAGAGTGAV